MVASAWHWEYEMTRWWSPLCILSPCWPLASFIMFSKPKFLLFKEDSFFPNRELFNAIFGVKNWNVFLVVNKQENWPKSMKKSVIHNKKNAINIQNQLCYKLMLCKVSKSKHFCGSHREDCVIIINKVNGRKRPLFLYTILFSWRFLQVLHH